tara:strand:+ start:2214 stop:2576 length:363 start_codon:yes stop_codon:yes gene_type:complete
MGMFTNLTPHPINILDGDGNGVMIIPSSGSIRLNEITDTVDVLSLARHVDGLFDLKILHITFEADNAISDWPVKPNHYYIVSALVANAYLERTDFLMVARTVRDENHRIIGCTALARATP